MRPSRYIVADIFGTNALFFLDEETFLGHFRAKGRFHDFNTAIPLAVVLAEQPGLRGCAQALATHQERD